MYGISSAVFELTVAIAIVGFVYWANYKFNNGKRNYLPLLCLPLFIIYILLDDFLLVESKNNRLIFKQFYAFGTTTLNIGYNRVQSITMINRKGKYTHDDFDIIYTDENGEVREATFYCHWDRSEMEEFQKNLKPYIKVDLFKPSIF